jgi:hypothetical protein
MIKVTIWFLTLIVVTGSAIVGAAAAERKHHYAKSLSKTVRNANAWLVPHHVRPMDFSTQQPLDDSTPYSPGSCWNVGTCD